MPVSPRSGRQPSVMRDSHSLLHGTLRALGLFRFVVLRFRIGPPQGGPQPSISAGVQDFLLPPRSAGFEKRDIHEVAKKHLYKS